MILTVTLNAAIDKRYVIDNYKTGGINRVSECTYSAGGKGLNVSKVAALAGEKVVATGFAGGYAGSYIIQDIEGKGIQTDFVNIAGESRSCISIYDKSSGMQTDFLEPGAFVTINNQEDLLMKYIRWIDKCDTVVISGGAPRGVDSAFYGELIRCAKQNNKKVLLDASGVMLEESVKEKPTLIKPNLEEFQALTGKKFNNQKELIQSAKSIQKTGIELVVISLGENGVIVVSDKEVFQGKIPKIEAVSTVGCGDAMVAGFAISFEKRLPLKESIQYSCSLAAANALRVENGFFIKKEAEEMERKIEVIKLE